MDQPPECLSELALLRGILLCFLSAFLANTITCLSTDIMMYDNDDDDCCAHVELAKKQLARPPEPEA